MRILFFFPVLLFSASLSISTSAPNICVLNSESGKIIYQKNMDEKIYPASVTKIATILYIIEECEMNEKTPISCSSDVLQKISEKKKVESNFSLEPHLLEDDGTTIYLKGGEILSLGDLLRAFMVKSANDAGNVLASVYAKSIAEFMGNMNRYLRGIGCKNTHFVNPHGLHHPDHMTTAHDLALILKRAIKHKLIRDIMATTTYEIPATNKSPVRELKTTNALIREDSKYYCPFVVGGKTGYHRRAKHNVAVFAEKNNRSIVAVVNNGETSDQRFADIRKILTAVYEEMSMNRVLFNAKEAKFTHDYPWGNDTVVASLKDDCILSYYPSEEENIDVQVHWEPIFNPIKPGDLVGTVDIYSDDGSAIYQQSIFSENLVDHSVSYKIRSVINQMIKFLATYPITSVLSFLIFFYALSRRKQKAV